MRGIRWLMTCIDDAIENIRYHLIYKKREEEVKEQLDQYKKSGYIIYATKIPGKIYVGTQRDFRQHIGPNDYSFHIDTEVAANLIAPASPIGGWDLEVLDKR